MPGRKPGRFAAEFASAICETCPLYAAGRCPPQPDNRRRSLRLDLRSSRSREVATPPAQPRQPPGWCSNPRAAVESTVRSVKHPFPAGKLPVRGPFRVTCLIVGAAAMTNVRRIQHYRLKTRPATAQRPKNQPWLRCNSLVPALAVRISVALGIIARAACLSLAALQLSYRC